MIRVAEAKVVSMPMWEPDTPETDKPDYFIRLGIRVALECGTVVFRCDARRRGGKQYPITYSITAPRRCETYRSTTPVFEWVGPANNRTKQLVMLPIQKESGITKDRFIRDYSAHFFNAVELAAIEAEAEWASARTPG